jgi:hypothetical protein
MAVQTLTRDVRLPHVRHEPFMATIDLDTLDDACPFRGANNGHVSATELVSWLCFGGGSP